MKSIVYSFLLLAAGLVLAGCSTTDGDKIDRGPISAQTFQFVRTKKPLPEYADSDQQLHTRVQNAITQSLTRRGLRQVETGGDVTVGYLIITGDGVTTSKIDDFFGYGRDAYALFEQAHDKYIHSANPNHFEAGTLLIDIVDSKSWQVLNRGHATRELQANLTPEQRTARVQEVVEQIFSEVRFKQ